MGKALAAFATVYLILVLTKDGTLPGLFNDAAKAGGDLANGLKPITANA